MTFVTVGNGTQGFRRLLDAVDRLAAEDLTVLKPVFIQAGHNPDFQPANCQTLPFVSMDEFQGWMQRADLIITHGGAGTLLHAARLGKVPVVMPRRRKYGELVNDHQVQLVEAFANEGLVVPAHEPEDLPDAITRARACGGRSGWRAASRMPGLLAQAIEDLMRR